MGAREGGKEMNMQRKRLRGRERQRVIEGGREKLKDGNREKGKQRRSESEIETDRYAYREKDERTLKSNSIER